MKTWLLVKVGLLVKHFVHGVVALEFRHVKAHTSNNDNRSLANKACDKFARKAMRKAREQLHIDGLKAILKGSKYASRNH